MMLTNYIPYLSYTSPALDYLNTMWGNVGSVKRPLAVSDQRKDLEDDLKETETYVLIRSEKGCQSSRLPVLTKEEMHCWDCHIAICMAQKKVDQSRLSALSLCSVKRFFYRCLTLT